jgi:hypothetical protein
MSAEDAAARIARLIARRKGGLVSFPLPMAMLTSLIKRLPDAIVARLIGQNPGAEPMTKRTSESIPEKLPR